MNVEYTLFDLATGEPLAIVNTAQPIAPEGAALVPGNFYETEDVWVEFPDAMGFVPKVTARFRLIGGQVFDDGVPIPEAFAI